MGTLSLHYSNNKRNYYNVDVDFVVVVAVGCCCCWLLLLFKTTLGTLSLHYSNTKRNCYNVVDGFVVVAVAAAAVYVDEVIVCVVIGFVVVVV